MYALPGILAIVAIDVLRPQEYIPALRGVPLLHLFTLLAMMGLVLDLRLGITRLRAAPHLVLSTLFVVWALVTTGLRDASWLVPRAVTLLIPFIVYLLIAHGLQSFRALELLVSLLLALTLILSVIGVHQGLADTKCFKVKADDGALVFQSDGRACTNRLDCTVDAPDPQYEYLCERAGLLGTSTIAGRVRFLGTLQDPNELALVLGVAMPFAFALFERRRSLARLALLVATVALVGACAYYTQSRGGQLVFLTVLGVYFVARVGVARGAILGAALAIPILLYGGRSGSSADASTEERILCWWTGMHLFVGSPVIGVGSGRFMVHHYLTAHNSYILAAAEMGIPGLFLWTGALYMAVKVPMMALLSDLEPIAKTWALALLASIAGLSVGVFFLSFNYKDVFWVYLAATGVLYGAIRRHAPSFHVGFGVRDAAIVLFVDLALMALLVVYTTQKLGW